MEGAFRLKNGGFPTFNVLRVPPSRVRPRTPEEFAVASVESYRQVGLTDAKVLVAGFLEIDGQNVLSVQIEYRRDGELLRSLVVGIPFTHADMLLTFISPTAKFERDKGAFEAILGSIQLREPLVNAAKGGERRTWLFPFGLLLLGAIAVVFLMAQKRILTNGERT